MMVDIDSTGFKRPLDAVVSGQFELCVPRQYRSNSAFIRNAAFKVEGQFTKVISVPITDDDAKEIKQHQCVIAGMQGSLLHYHTRQWPVMPSKREVP